MAIMYFLWWTNQALNAFHMTYVRSVIDKTGIHEIWIFKLNFTMKINTNQSAKQQAR